MWCCVVWSNDVDFDCVSIGTIGESPGHVCLLILVLRCIGDSPVRWSLLLCECVVLLCECDVSCMCGFSSSHAVGVFLGLVCLVGSVSRVFGDSPVCWSLMLLLRNCEVSCIGELSGTHNGKCLQVFLRVFGNFFSIVLGIKIDDLGSADGVKYTNSKWWPL